MCSPTWERLRLPRKGREPIRRTLSWLYVGNFDTIPYRGIASQCLRFPDSSTFQVGLSPREQEKRIVSSVPVRKRPALIFLFSRVGSFHFAARNIAACSLSRLKCCFWRPAELFAFLTRKSR